MVTVLWHMNTYTSAATDFMAVKNQITLNFNSNPQYRKDIKAWCKKKCITSFNGNRLARARWIKQKKYEIGLYWAQ